MFLSDFFEAKRVVRDVEFEATYYQHNDLPFKLVCFLDSFSRIDLTNQNDSVVGVITTEELGKEISFDKGLVLSNDPKGDFFKLHNELVLTHGLKVTHDNYIASSADIGNAAHIGENVFIGENVKLGYGVIIYDNSYIGNNVFIDDYVIIGAKGIQYPGVICAGGVKIGQNCEIRAFSIIGRPYQAFYTTLKPNIRIGQKVTIAHGCQIGEKTFIATNSSLAGNCRVGKNVYIGLSSTLTDATNVGDDAIIRTGSIVINDIKEGEEVSGNFAYSHKRNLLNFVKLRKKLKK
jgi:UDP-3-O-[3-hydroxymyristoyl] glucosamine N-acyltransferase